MLYHDHPLRAIAALHLADLRRSARSERLFRSQRPSRRPIRRAIGQSLIGIGSRLAAEPYRQPARSR